MRLITPKHFAKKYFEEDCAPSQNTIRTWIDDEVIPGGVRIGSRYYIDAEKLENRDELILDRMLS